MNAHPAELNKGTAKLRPEAKTGQKTGKKTGKKTGPKTGQMAIPLANGDSDPLVMESGVESRLAQPVETDLASDRALVLTDLNPPDVSVGERLLRIAYRMGFSNNTLVAPFRKPAPLRLLATVENPLEGDRVAGMALRAGHFLIHGVKTPIAQIDFTRTAKLTPPFERVVHGFTWLRDLDCCGARAQTAPVAERITLAWLDENADPAKGTAWKVENAGLRLLAWLVHAPLILSDKDGRLRRRLLATAEDTARWLDKNVTRADDRLGEVAGWCAITAAGLLLPDGKPRRLYGEAGLIRALGEMVGEDGGSLSRSPLAQMQAIALLVELAACYRATRRDPPEALNTMLAMLVPPLLGVMHGDGSIGSWQGAAPVPAAGLAQLIEATGVRTRPLRDVLGWGYQRVVAKPAVLQFDAAPPPLARHARNGSASTLAFEFSHGDHRLIVNCGGAATAGGQVPMRIEQALRATAAHSTLVLGDANSTAVLINGKLGGGVREVEIDRALVQLDEGKGKGTGSGKATRLEASHDGYTSRFGLLHRRILMLREDGSELRGEDLLVPSGRKGKRGKVPFAIRFHLGPTVEVRLGSGRNAGLVLPDGSYWQFVTGAEKLELDESLWVDGNGRPHPVQQLVIQGLASRGGGSFSWLLKKMG